MQPRLLILETSHRLGKVALACGETVISERGLDESRRHARDLVPAVQEMLKEKGWRARELDGVIVSRGPGSYTGLRVGLMSAKTLAYAAGCALLAIDTFDAIFSRAQSIHPRLDIIADAQQDKVYVQRFGDAPEPLAIMPWEQWIPQAASANVAVTGPGLEIFADRVPKPMQILPRDLWYPQPQGLLEIGLKRFLQGERDDPFQVEPLYLRPSSAEEKWTSSRTVK